MEKEPITINGLEKLKLELDDLKKISPEDLPKQRYEKFRKMGKVL